MAEQNKKICECTTEFGYCPMIPDGPCRTCYGGKPPENSPNRANYDLSVKHLESEVSATYKKAFFDLLEQKVAADPPDYDWLTRLYEEIRGKLLILLRTGSDLHTEISESMDVDLFKQMISNKAFDPADLSNLVSYVFAKCKQLCSPARDEDTDAKLQEIVDHMATGKATFVTVVPMFIRNANHCIDTIYDDIQQLSNHMDKI